MSDIKNTTYLKDNEIGNIHISEEVVSVIAGIAATEAEEVVSLVGNITNNIVSKMGIKNLSKGIRLKVIDKSVYISVTVNLRYGCNIPAACKNVQERVYQAIENMTSLTVAEVNVYVNDITLDI